MEKYKTSEWSLFGLGANWLLCKERWPCAFSSTIVLGFLTPFPMVRPAPWCCWPSGYSWLLSTWRDVEGHPCFSWQLQLMVSSAVAFILHFFPAMPLRKNKGILCWLAQCPAKWEVQPEDPWSVREYPSDREIFFKKGVILHKWRFINSLSQCLIIILLECCVTESIEKN